MKRFIFAGIICLAASYANACTPTPTTASGWSAPQGFCSGQLIFEDNFDSLDHGKWYHEVTMAGGGNYEFQWYVNDRFNSYTVGGNLHIKPSFTSDIFGNDFLYSGRVIIPPEECTHSWNWGCDRTGSYNNIINPIRSAILTSTNSFSFKYGTLEIRAKAPAGDWLWPALWMMPKHSVYGEWPRSGEIDLMESRGNRFLYAQGGHVGTEQVGSTLHFGPQSGVNGWPTAHRTKNRVPGWNEDFHLYKLVWTTNSLQFYYDNEHIETISVGSGFWDRGNFGATGLPNPWTQGTIMAPFDQEFYIILNLAVGGTMFFDDSFTNRDSPKTWTNNSPRAAADFWEGRHYWEPTWEKTHTDHSHLIVDYVRVWAL